MLAFPLLSVGWTDVIDRQEGRSRPVALPCLSPDPHQPEALPGTDLGQSFPHVSFMTLKIIVPVTGPQGHHTHNWSTLNSLGHLAYGNPGSNLQYSPQNRM